MCKRGGSCGCSRLWRGVSIRKVLGPPTDRVTGLGIALPSSVSDLWGWGRGENACGSWAPEAEQDPRAGNQDGVESPCPQEACCIMLAPPYLLLPFITGENNGSDSLLQAFDQRQREWLLVRLCWSYRGWAMTIQNHCKLDLGEEKVKDSCKWCRFRREGGRKGGRG